MILNKVLLILRNYTQKKKKNASAKDTISSLLQAL